MLAKGHIIANSCSTLWIASGILATYNHFCVESVSHPVSNTIRSCINFVYMNREMPKTIYIPIAFFLFFIGTLFPDCDARDSAIGRIIYIPVQHRTWTHAIWIPVIGIIASFFLPILFWFNLGYVLHILWDNLSMGGVCFLYPITKYEDTKAPHIKKHHFFKIYRSGAISETILLMAIIAFTLSLLFIFYKTGLYNNLSLYRY